MAMAVTGHRISDTAPDQRPRERLLRLGPETLTDTEVVAVLLGSGRPGAQVVGRAGELLQRCGGPAALMTALPDSLARATGVGGHSGDGQPRSRNH